MHCMCDCKSGRFGVDLIKALTDIECISAVFSCPFLNSTEKLLFYGMILPTALKPPSCSEKRHCYHHMLNENYKHAYFS